MSTSRPSDKELKDMEIKNINISLRAFGSGEYASSKKSRRILTEEEEKNLNTAQQTALLDMPYLSSTIFSKEQRSWFKHTDHTFALRELIESQKLSPEEAMQKLSGLTDWQAMGLVNGLSKEEVIGLNKWQVLTLESLREHGLTHTDLRGKNWFDSFEQQFALKEFMTSGMSAKKALEKLEKKFCLTDASNFSGLSQSSRLSSLWKEPPKDKIAETPKEIKNTGKRKMEAIENSNVSESNSKKLGCG
jgi:hypothetical protein